MSTKLPLTCPPVFVPWVSLKPTKALSDHSERQLHIYQYKCENLNLSRYGLLECMGFDGYRALEMPCCFVGHTLAMHFLTKQLRKEGDLMQETLQRHLS